MKKIHNILLKKRTLFSEKKRYLIKKDEEILNDHKNDLQTFKIALFEKFNYEYKNNNNDILHAKFEFKIEKYPSGYIVITFYNNHGYRKILDEKYLFKYGNLELDNQITKTFEGIYPKFSAKQILISGLYDQNIVVTYCISRNNFKKILDRMEYVRKEYNNKNLEYIYK